MRSQKKHITISIAILAFLFCTFSSTVSQAQYNSSAGNILPVFRGHHWKKTGMRPKAILVQLRSEQSRIEFFTEKKQLREANRVKREAAIIRKVVKNDFEENFSFCPVYYFIDTNLEMIKKQQFEGVLFTADGLPMKRNILHPGDTNYFIVCYGYPEEQMELDAMREEYPDISSSEVMGKGLIFLNYKYRQVDFYYHFGYSDLFNPPNPRYAYISMEYDMEYFPFAGKYEQDLEETFNGIMVSRKLPHY